MELRQKSTTKRSAKTSEKFSALRNLRNKKLTTSEYLKSTDQDSAKIYDEVDEDEYQKYQKEQLELDDFVIEDDVQGYVDKGQENEYDDYSDSEEDTAKKSKRRVNNADQPSGDKKIAKLNTYFRNIHSKGIPANKARLETKKDATAENELMDALFKDLEKNSIDDKKRKNAPKPTASNLVKMRKPLNYGPTPARIQNLKQPRELGLDKNSALNQVPTFGSDNIIIKAEPLDDDFSNFDDDDFALNFGDSIETQLKDEHEDFENSENSENLTNLGIGALIDDEDDAELEDWLSYQDDISMNSMEHTVGTISSQQGSEPELSKSNSMDSDESACVDVFWFDAVENNGVVYLFGKTLNKSNGQYSSVCIIVNGIERNFFVLPRIVEGDTDVDGNENRYGAAQIHGEIEQILIKNGIRQFGSKMVERKYAFDIPGVPATSDYLKVVMGFDTPSLPPDLSGKYVERVFGTSYSALELFFLKRRIMGPCWLRILEVKKSSPKLSWCRQEYSIESPKLVKVLTDEECAKNKYQSSIPLNVVSISVKTILNTKKNTNEIVAASFYSIQNLNINDTKPIQENNKEHTVIVRQLEGVPFPHEFERIATQNTQKAIAARGKQNIKIAKSERDLLLIIIGIFARIDPDIIVGHNFLGFLLDVLLHRMKAAKLSDWSKLGRLRRTVWPKLQPGVGGMGESTYSERQIMSGRVVCDSYLTSKDLIRSKSYSLTQLSLSELMIKREEFSLDRVTEAFMTTSSPEPLLMLCRHTAFDAYLCMLLIHRLQTLPLTCQLTNLAGNLWSRTMTGARAERNEFLLLHEFYNMKFIRPDKKAFNSNKPTQNDTNLKSVTANDRNQSSSEKAKNLTNDSADYEAMDNTAYDAEDSDGEENDASNSNNQKPAAGTSGRRKPAYAGGLVLDPKKGLYDQYVLLMDFNSLYPSIIQEFNICFTTVPHTQDDDNIPQDPDPSLPMGSLPRLLRTLVERRKQVKKLLKAPGLSESDKMALDVRQKALKLTANSMYGCLGFTHSRFYAKALAILITSKGRQILVATQSLAESQGLEVLYGDTDSIMINTASNILSESYELGAKFKRQVNERYKLLELDIDGVFRRLLLLKKKKYAALLVSGPPERNSLSFQEGSDETPIEKVPTKLETRGLDLVRRDWCEISHDVSTFVLNKLLSGLDIDTISSTIYDYLTQMSGHVRSGLVKLDKYIINKGLSKPPESYNETSALPHVSVALRMKKFGYSFKSGDTVPYVMGLAGKANASEDKRSIVDSENTVSRSFHPEEIKKSQGSVRIDAEWYLAQQILPPIMRLVEPIEGIEVSRMATALGLDSTRYKGIYSNRPSGSVGDELKTFESQIPDSERFKNCDPLIIPCYSCGNNTNVDGIASLKDHGIISGLVCDCKAPPRLAYTVTQVKTQIRDQINRFYQTEYECTEPGCGFRSGISALNSTFSVGNSAPKCPRYEIGCQGVLRRCITERALYNQLLYYSSLFDLSKTKSRIRDINFGAPAGGNSNAVESKGDLELQVDKEYIKYKIIHERCASSIKSYLDCSSYKFVDLGALFRSLKL